MQGATALRTQAVSRLTKTHEKSSVSATFRLHPPHIGGGLGGGGCFFASFFAPKKVRINYNLKLNFIIYDKN